MAENEDKIVKKRYTVWLSEELIDKINKSYKQLGFRTKNDLVEEAVVESGTGTYRDCRPTDCRSRHSQRPSATI